MRRIAERVLAQNAERLDSEIIYNRDFDYDYFGFKVCGLRMLVRHQMQRSSKHPGSRLPQCSLTAGVSSDATETGNTTGPQRPWCARQSECACCVRTTGWWSGRSTQCTHSAM